MKIRVRVKPNSKKPYIEKGEDGIWIVAVREPATEGKANNAIIKAVAEELGIAPSKVDLVKGMKSKEKVLEIHD
ncbi:DUF167 domain-containing protein [Leptospira langatensis]|uniref:DUF167 domain-containing protein n=1 Tax=Leptospira langatensis TaxID=2484983 RepID=A0A5F1ZNY5_9LEPT|nr:DUF167 domain-containing protein [Leptospira langatensis]TGK05389.1 DUF167 domain-containing protein [Leptospira langatensis]TGL38525.1 DUF167 domain-containing protein [Leptospira langatensis]